MTIAVSRHAPTRDLKAGCRPTAVFSTAVPDMSAAAGLPGKDG
ncbi:MAG: hypothetical protein OXM57_11640 [bacterium]|nr:hypothetical protein [bacterium]MDE0353331.1 hypothetical protein [bacterium]